MQILHIKLSTKLPITRTDVDVGGEGVEDAQALREF